MKGYSCSLGVVPYVKIFALCFFDYQHVRTKYQQRNIPYLLRSSSSGEPHTYTHWLRQDQGHGSVIVLLST